jgi:hypothetical protein
MDTRLPRLTFKGMKRRSPLTARARQQLFARGIKTHRLSEAEIEEALPAGTLSPMERWLLYYSLRAAGVEIDPAGG